MRNISIVVSDFKGNGFRVSRRVCVLTCLGLLVLTQPIQSHFFPFAVFAPSSLNAAQETRSADPRGGIAIDNPERDGWDTEVFHLQVKKRLQVLGKLISDSAPTGPSPKTSQTVSPANTHTNQPFSPNAVCTCLHPPPESTYQADGIRVDRWRQSEPSVFDQQPDAALAELVSVFSAEQNLRVEFKVVGVKLQVDPPAADLQSSAAPEILPSPETEQLVSIFGTTSQGTAEYLATWTIQWTAPDSDQPYRIQKISVQSVQVSQNQNSTGPLLTDLSDFVLGDNFAWQQQHHFGLNYWSDRIETNLNRDLMGHQGIAIGDVDGDQIDDIYVCQTGGLPNRLYRNGADVILGADVSLGADESVGAVDGRAVDISANSGVNFLDLTTSALFADWDNDGDADLLVAMEHGLAILSNDATGKFTSAYFTDRLKHIYSPTAVDFDNDGDLDIYCCTYYPAGASSQVFPVPYPFENATNGGRNVLLRNEGKFHFVDVTDQVGLDENNSRYSYSAGWEDIDRDGDLDLYVANDFGRNNLYVNDAGKFRDLTDAWNAEDGNFGMSVSWGDVDLDGWPDVYISNMFSSAGNRIVPQANFNPGLNETGKQKFLKLARGNTLLKNIGGKKFEDISEKAGVTLGRWAWSSALCDLNNDGWEDILVGNGYITGEDSGDL